MLIDELKAARILAAQKRPYFSSIIFGFNFVPTTDIPTVACDARLNFYYNPEFHMERDEAIGVILHEVGHVFRKHHERSANKDPMTWNVAGDALINKELRESGIRLPDGTIDYRELGMGPGDVSSTESAYRFLYGDGENEDDGDNENNTSEDSGGSSGSRGGADTGDEESSDDANTGSNEGDEGDEDGNSSAGAGQVQPDCGSVADGAPRPYETNSGMPPSSVVVAVEQAAQDVLDHEASHPGEVPGGILIRARTLKARSVSLEKAMRRIIGNAEAEKKTGTDDYTFTRPSRRHAHSDIVFPSMRSVDTILRVGIVLDTSGSMVGMEIRKALGALMSMSKKIRMEIYATSVDVRSYGVEKLQPSDLERWFDSIRGGGGTELTPGIIDVYEFDPLNRPDLIVLLTDGEVFFPKEKPIPKKIPVYMLKVSDAQIETLFQPPPWIRTFVLTKQFTL